MSQEKIEREYWVDNLKAIGIFFVVLGHLSIPTSLKNYIYSFHIPLFFFISGYLFNSVKYSNFWKFFKNRFSRIIIPYFFFSFITYLFWVFFTCRFFEDPEMKKNLIKPFIGIFYSNGIDGWLQYNVPIWFLTTLFLTEIAFFIFHKYIKNSKYLTIFLLALSIIGYIASIQTNIRLPWNINAIPLVLMFYFTGFYYKNSIKVLIKNIDLKYLFIAIALVALNVIIGFARQRVDINNNLYGNYLVFYVAAFEGIFCYAVLAKMIGKNKIIDFIGQSSLVIMCLHSPIAYIIKYVQYFVFHIPLNYSENNIAFAILFSILQIVLIVPMILFFKKFLPRLSGYKNMVNKQ